MRAVAISLRSASTLSSARHTGTRILAGSGTALVRHAGSTSKGTGAPRADQHRAHDTAQIDDRAARVPTTRAAVAQHDDRRVVAIERGEIDGPLCRAAALAHQDARRAELFVRRIDHPEARRRAIGHALAREREKGTLDRPREVNDRVVDGHQRAIEQRGGVQHLAAYGVERGPAAPRRKVNAHRVATARHAALHRIGDTMCGRHQLIGRDEKRAAERRLTRVFEEANHRDAAMAIAAIHAHDLTAPHGRRAARVRRMRVNRFRAARS